MSNLTPHELALIKNEMGEVSFEKLRSEVNKITNGILVDIGVYEGASSRVMIDSALVNNNNIYAIDPVPSFNSTNPNYTYIKDDSVEVGKEWNKTKADLVFFDSVHAKEQVLCELYYWWELIKENGLAIFHDTSWAGYVHKAGHSCAGKLTGNSGLGYDSYGGIDWETPDKAVEEFFHIPLNTPTRDIENDTFIPLYEDEYIKVETNYALLGMTLIKKKKHWDYRTNISNWEDIFTKREILLSSFKN